MNLKNMTIKELEERKAAIAIECDKEGADVDALLEEARAINAELEERKALESKRAKIRDMVAAGTGSVVAAAPAAETKSFDEIRSSHEYNVAYANYIKTGKADECRALLSENATNGTVAVPVYVEERVRTAWEKDAIARKVKKSYLRGNLSVGFEISSDGATIHTEGSGAVNEENLVLGIVSLVPQSIKKWISISDEALDLSGEAFLNYIYDEITYQIAKKAVDELLAKIVALSTTATTTAVNVGVVTATQASVSLVAQGLGQLSDQTSPQNTLLVMNKLTWSAFKAAQAANGFNYDPFEGYEVAFNNSLPSVTAATSGEAWMIIGDFTEGAQFNFPNGNEITFKFDDLTAATSDLVKVIGREFVGIGVVGPKAFCKVVK